MADKNLPATMTEMLTRFASFFHFIAYDYLQEFQNLWYTAD